MIKSIGFSLLLLLIGVECLSKRIPCNTSNECVAKDSGRFCALVDIYASKVCVQCNFTQFTKDCDCPMSQYCVADPQDVCNLSK